MLLEGVETGASGTAKIAAGGSSFFLDLALFAELGGDPALLRPGAELGEEDAALLRAAAEASEAYRRGLSLLARSEQPRRLLEAKLAQRGFSARAARQACERLEREGLLDDGRFAEAWLRSRIGRSASSRLEGPAELLAGLRGRGVEEAIAKAALRSVLGPEERAALLRKAGARSLLAAGGDREAARQALRGAGWGGEEIRAWLEDSAGED
jgi:regulatory protein